jgi:hypothetical protein
MKDLNDITLEEFQAMENFGQTETFNDVIIVPTTDIHDSGYRCMKFVLVRRRKIVGCVGGYNDVVYPNGKGNVGLHPNLNMYAKGFIPAMNMTIDCLKESGCVRLMFRRNALKCEEFICSDFLFYLTGEKV